MFAEPVRTAAQQEDFWVMAGATRFAPEQIGLPEPTHRQLLRNYHYRGQGQALLARLALALARQPGAGAEVRPWRLYRAVGPDTAQVADWVPGPRPAR
nr:hypothetical protein [Bernardetiaceae bacterium]